MSDRGPLRDRTLILRILVPGLETSLRDKMKEQQSGSPASKGESFLNLPGVTCEPTAARNKTLWNFHCDGATYPAQLVNLPCPIELHKTQDHVIYLKSVDVAQMLIVYEDEMALEEADQEVKPAEGLQYYYHSGLTPPTRKIVQNRFAKREQRNLPPPRGAIMEVEEELLQLMETLAKDEKRSGGSGGGRNKVPSLTSATKKLEVVEEVVVEYEPWMDEFGSRPDGVEFDALDPFAKQHPEIWLSPQALQDIREEEAAKVRSHVAAAAKKKKAAEEPKKKTEKKGIASRKNEEPVDAVTEAAAFIMSGDGTSLLDEEFDLSEMFDLDLDAGLEGLE